ncbi:MAG: YqgE/AlgH family protein [Chlamydiales bacterium]
MENMPYSHIEKGTFLVATPEIESGLFFRAVVLVCEHNPSGSFGIIVNKPLDIELPEEIIQVEEFENSHIEIRAGGPIQTNQMMLLHTSPEIPQQSMEICKNVYLGGDLAFLQEGISRRDGPYIYLCFGYAGWGAGALEREFMDGSWLLYPASRELLFDVQPDQLWKNLLIEMGGRYASLSMIPEDLSLN